MSSQAAEDEARRKQEKPQCDAAQVIAFVRAHFTLPDSADIDETSVKERPSRHCPPRHRHACGTLVS
jgi:hypothetical protein